MRTYSLLKDTQILSMCEDWLNLLTVGRVAKYCEMKDKKAEETRYYISSKDHKIESFAEGVRNHG